MIVGNALTVVPDAVAPDQHDIHALLKAAQAEANKHTGVLPD
ncbi:hypothetical protein [Haloquadratum walsbyi]|nr:hypothetical protein [Haloquadratum walsbyi]